MNTENNQAPQKRGRKKGYMMPSTTRKLAINTLQNVLKSDDASIDSKALAAAKLLEEIPS